MSNSGESLQCNLTFQTNNVFHEKNQFVVARVEDWSVKKQWGANVFRAFWKREKQDNIFAFHFILIAQLLKFFQIYNKPTPCNQGKTDLHLSQRPSRTHYFGKSSTW